MIKEGKRRKRSREIEPWKMNIPALPEDWEEITPEQLSQYRSHMTSFIEAIVDANKQGAKRQLTAIRKPMEIVQDSIIKLNEQIKK